MIGKTRIWTEEQIKFILDNYKELDFRDISERLGIPYRTLVNKAHKLGFKRSNRFKSERQREKQSKSLKQTFKEGRMDYLKKTWFKKGKRANPHYEFKKGNIPHNKGKTKEDYLPLKIVSEKIKKIRMNWITAKKDTKIEIKIQNFLKELNIPFEKNYYVGFNCDIYIPSMNLVIEIDGEYWHNYPFGTLRDFYNDRKLFLNNYNQIRLWGN